MLQQQSVREACTTPHLAHDLQQVKGASQVVVVVIERLSYALADSLETSKVDYTVKLVLS